MEAILRQSPVVFDARPVRTETRNHWPVVLEYEKEDENQGAAPRIADLSHCARWDVQDADLGQIEPAGVAIPETPGHCRLAEGVLINRMNRTQAAVWHISGEAADLPGETAYTETSEGTLLVALFGPGTFDLAEKLTNLDLRDPGQDTPYLLQGPFSHVPCQVVVLNNSADNPGILFTCSRGYGQDMTRAILHAGHSLGLRPAGEKAFQNWLQAVV